ncbi:hypothetical protein SAMN05661008_01511 [Alkalithermobacter thermoalcaliphilus JW-YL-7 = DSM 7308]|uniref:Putative sigma factor n=1 Tax=Alkalithermobacter thermoalcaliphilus JW-YL-7 = DSM 7308 TaxID=1121328 RepID=A0A150FR09_CLOPD|nr:putative sigma factor [[Clostridium] paradoxum JW-YL-7 = DSM 7308]SHL13058.1 hypothetical protein SAMN05661008_01511 [[Clostridium] paradoxum JW-YL-7 = DSM 7308]
MKIIDILKEYIIIETRIKDLQFKLKELDEYENLGVSAIDYSKHKSATYKFSSIVEDQAISIAEKKALMNAEIIHLETLKKRIDNAVNSLTEEEAAVVRKKFIEGNKWYKVAIEIYKSERCSKQIGQRALEKLEKILFGSEVKYGKYRNNL